MAFKEWFLRHLGTGLFSGCTLGGWLRVLRDNRFAVDPPYWPRAVGITSAAALNSAVAAWESLRFGRHVRAARVEPPIFILGIWRSGTTHLHNLLARDERFAFPNQYQTTYPLTFLSTERLSAGFVNRFVPSKRPQDNVAMGMREPQEDEFALTPLTGRSAVMAWPFPRNAEYYDRYLTLRRLSPRERDEWKAGVLLFVKKLSYKYSRPLVLKSPGHTGRIRTLLELFPDARFVHIQRNPYDVFQSMQHLFRSILPWLALQRPPDDWMQEKVFEQYTEIYDAFFEDRSLIPKGQFCELRFEDLETDAMGELRRVYESLNLPDFSIAEPVLRRYLDSLTGYRKNKFVELLPELRERVARGWRRSFDEWGYSM